MEKIIRQVKMEPRRIKLQRVAAYARVSSGKEAMLHSLSEQISYYSDHIQSHPGWEYAGVYADADYTPERRIPVRNFSVCWRIAARERSTAC